MGQLAEIFAAINADVVASLAAAEFPPLTDGRILWGRSAQFGQSAPPRIIMTLLGSDFAAPDVADRGDAAERRALNAQRSIANEDLNFEVRCWGASSPPDPIDDIDVTRALYHAVRQALMRLAPGAYTIEASGKFTDATFAGSQIVRNGREYVFGLTIHGNVLGKLQQYAPRGVGSGSNTVHLSTPNGASEGVQVK